MVSHIAFTLFVALLALQRLLELRKSEQHRKQLLLRGGREHGAGHFPFMAFLHGSWLIAMCAEVWLLERVASTKMAIIAGLIFLIGQILRILAMNTLGERWCARIITLPNRPPVTQGIFRYMRHPNYLGVVLEIASAPMLHNAYITAIIYTLLNFILLAVRIKAEEQALDSDNNYWASFRAQS